MSMLSHTFKKAIELRCDLALLGLLGKSCDLSLDDLQFEAFILGQGYDGGASAMLRNTPLYEHYEAGSKYVQDFYDSLEPEGTQEEWDALSSDEQWEQWDSFHELCAQGIADTMYFYRVMMSMHLENYVGH